MLLDLPPELIEQVLRHLPPEDLLSFAFTSKKLVHRPSVDMLQALVGINRFHRATKKYRFSQLKYEARLDAVEERHKAVTTLLTRFHARFGHRPPPGSYIDHLRTILQADVDRAHRMNTPSMVLALADDSFAS